ncbi:hypothetical protein [Mycobacterium sp. HNNTM2301]|uniref:hypothetical protein n=1 Tax=Mycobacterium hainanense TaxID=3289775 RepID=UPI0035A5C913
MTTTMSATVNYPELLRLSDMIATADEAWAELRALEKRIADFETEHQAVFARHSELHRELRRVENSAWNASEDLFDFGREATGETS